MMEIYSTKHKVTAIFVGLILLIPIAFLGGVVLSDLWNWFVAPSLHFPSITMQQAIGLTFVSGFLTSHLEIKKHGKKLPPFRAVGHAIGYKTVFILLTWGLGAIWHLFI